MTGTKCKLFGGPLDGMEISEKSESSTMVVGYAIQGKEIFLRPYDDGFDLASPFLTRAVIYVKNDGRWIFRRNAKEGIIANTVL